MSHRVDACATSIRHCSEEDREIADAASRDNVKRGGKPLPAHVTPDGPTRLEVKASEGSAAADARALIGRFAKRAVEGFTKGHESLLEKLFEKYAGLPGKTYKYTKEVTEAHEHIVEQARSVGVKLDEAARRDAMNLVVIDIVNSKLDPAYVAAAHKERAGSREVARGIQHRLVELPPAKFTSLIKSLNRSAAEGVSEAKARSLAGDADLRRALGEDRSFAARYHAETAFRHGVHSEMHAAGRRAKAP